MKFRHFDRIINKKYPELHKLCEDYGYVNVPEYDVSNDTDDVLVFGVFPEIIEIYDDVVKYFGDNGYCLSAVGFRVLWIRILEWLEYNPERIAWVVL